MGLPVKTYSQRLTKSRVSQKIEKAPFKPMQMAALAVERDRIELDNTKVFACYQFATSHHQVID